MSQLPSQGQNVRNERLILCFPYKLSTLVQGRATVNVASCVRSNQQTHSNRIVVAILPWCLSHASSLFTLSYGNSNTLLLIQTFLNTWVKIWANKQTLPDPCYVKGISIFWYYISYLKLTTN